MKSVYKFWDYRAVNHVPRKVCVEVCVVVFFLVGGGGIFPNILFIIVYYVLKGPWGSLFKSISLHQCVIVCENEAV